MLKTFLAVAALLLAALVRPDVARATDVYFENECSDELRIAVRFTDSSGRRQTDGYFAVAPGESEWLFSTDEGIFEFYAYDQGRTWRGDHLMPSISSDYSLESHLVTFDSDLSRYTHALSCDSSYGDANLYQIRMATECNHDIFVALRYQDLDGRWQMKSWYRIVRGDVAYLPKTRLDYFYYFAESERFTENGEETRFTFEGPHDFSVEGDVEGFIQKDINPGSHALLLTCND